MNAYGQKYNRMMQASSASRDYSIRQMDMDFVLLIFIQLDSFYNLFIKYYHV